MAYNFAFLALGVISHDKAEGLFADMQIVFNDQTILFDPINEVRSTGVLGRHFRLQAKQFLDMKRTNREAFDRYLSELWRLAARAYVREAHEAIKLYLDVNDLLPIVEAQPWYRILRIARNAFSHNGRFAFTSIDRRHLPFEWNGKTMHVDLEGTMIDSEFLGPFSISVLHLEIVAFLSGEKFVIEELFH